MTDSAIQIFYSWQSDLPDSSNRGLIRRQLRVASNKIEASTAIRINQDEATRDLAGSPNIPAAIQEKILSADIFICDVSTINGSESPRKCPNPNVVFELGFAVANLGWNRVVLLFNQEYGSLQDLPFDFDRHRAAPYRASEKPSKEQASQLASLLEDCINAVIRVNPPKPTEKLSPEEERHARDVRTLDSVFSNLHIPTLDDHLDRIPHSLFDTALDFWERFNGVVASNSFHLYDSRAFSLVRDLHKSFRTTVCHGEQYHPTSNSRLYVFSSASRGVMTTEQEEAWSEIEAARDQMRVSLGELLLHVREKYLEIDLHSTDASAWKKYLDDQREALKSLGLDG